MLPRHRRHRRHGRHRAAALALPALLLAPLLTLAAAPADAAPDDHDRWLAPSPLAPRADSYGYQREPAIATNARGDSVAVYLDDPPIDGAPTGIVMMTRRPAGGAWSKPVGISGGYQYGTSTVDVGIDATGRGLVVWQRYDWMPDDIDEVWARTVPLRGSLPPARRLSAPGVAATAPVVAVAPSGRAAVTWLSDRDVVARTGSTSGLGPTTTVAAGAGERARPTVAISDAGDATLAWTATGAGPDAGRSAHTCTWPGGSASGCGEVIVHDAGAGGAAVEPAVAVGESGDAVLCFGLDAATNTIGYAVRDSQGAWSAPVVAVGDAERPALVSCRVEVRPDGSAVLAYADRSAQAFVRVLRGTDDGVGPRQRITRGIDDEAYDVSLAAGPAGEVAVVTSGGDDVAAAVVRPGTDTVSRQRVRFPRPESGYGSTRAAVAVDAEGNAYGMAVSDACDLPYCANSRWRPWTMAFDAAAPSVAEVVVPGSGRVGDGVRLRAVGVRDLASAVTVTWRFSDGTTRTGPSVSKVLREPGRLDVRLVLSDRAGHRTVRQATIDVTR